MGRQIDAVGVSNLTSAGLFTVLFNNTPLMLVRARTDGEALARAARSLVFARGCPQISAEVDRQLYTGPAALRRSSPVADDRFDARAPTAAERAHWNTRARQFGRGSNAALSGLLL